MVSKDYITRIKKDVNRLPKDVDTAKIEATADELEHLNYSPELIIEAPDFLKATHKSLITLIDRAVEVKKDKLTKEALGEILYQYQLLHRLREDDPEAWDEINEMVESE